jgi:hypothetical protein
MASKIWLITVFGIAPAEIDQISVAELVSSGRCLNPKIDPVLACALQAGSPPRLGLGAFPGVVRSP